MQNSGFTSNSNSNQQTSQPTSTARQVPLHSFSTSSQPAANSLSSDSTQQNMKGSMNSSRNLVIVLGILVILGGAATGVGIGKLRAAQSGSNVYQGKPIQAVAGTNIKNGDIFGSAKESDFKDSADGYMEAGGIAGEGSDKLLRPGGASQTVYLTSSVTDLSKFEGMKVKVWGETYQAQKAGWLMDVGRVEVIDTQAQPPTEK